MEELAMPIERAQLAPADQKYILWISKKSWKLIDKKSEVRRTGTSELIKTLKKQLAKSIQDDCKIRIGKWQIKFDTK
jgi:hypothetical protein